MVGVFTVIGALTAAAFADPAGAPAGDRLLHLFDFDERDEGNLEHVPKYWVRFGGADFPRYAEGEFDRTIGHDAPPSFRLTTQGRNVAYRYTARRIDAISTNDYLVVAWIRGEMLSSARAAISAYYLDHDQLPIRSSQRFSELVSTESGSDDWRRVEVFLPAGTKQAVWIGLTLWAVHPESWYDGPRPRRHIERRDMAAQAWFDDIRVYRLPRVDIATSAPGNVFTPADEAVLSVKVTDADSYQLRATLDVLDVDGRSVRRAEIPVQSSKRSIPVRIDFKGAPNGLYRARVRVVSTAGEDGATVIANRTLDFASVQTVYREQPAGARAFGVSFDVKDRADPLDELKLLRSLRVGAVKMPIWSGLAGVPDLIDSDPDTDTLLYELLKARVAVTGVFVGPPSELVRAAGAYRRSLLTMLNEDPEAWREHLVRVFAPYASIFRSWQIGLDGDPAIAADPQLPDALRRVRAEILKLTTAPHLTTPGALTWEPQSDPPAADDVSFAIDRSILPEYIASHVEEYRKRGMPVSTAFVQPTGTKEIDYRGHLRDWCKRLLHARHAGIRTVTVPQPWHTRLTTASKVTEPSEEFVLLHTLADLTGGTVPGDPVYIAPGVTALAFHDRDTTVLALWDNEAGEAGRTHTIQLGSATRQIDMWGRARPLTTAEDGRQEVHLTADPVFIDGIDRWLIAFRTELRLVPDFEELSIDAHQHELGIVNPRDEPLAGTVQLGTPDAWDINPRQFRFSIRANGTVNKPFEIRYGRNTTAGTGMINAEFTLDADRRYRVVVPLPLELGVRDIDAWGHTVLSSDRLIVRHRVFNRGDKTLNLRAFAIAPGRLRQTRLLTQLLPGQSKMLEYHFKDPESLRQRTIRLHLRDLNGPRIHNIEVDVE